MFLDPSILFISYNVDSVAITLWMLFYDFMYMFTFFKTVSYVLIVICHQIILFLIFN